MKFRKNFYTLPFFLPVLLGVLLCSNEAMPFLRTMELQEKLLAQLAILNQKVDRLNSIVSQLPTTHNTNLGDWLDEHQTRELLHRGATSLWDLRKTKKLKFKKMGNRNYYSRQSIIDFLEGKNKK